MQFFRTGRIRASLDNVDIIVIIKKKFSYTRNDIITVIEYLLVYYLTRIGHLCCNSDSETTNISVISIHQVTLLHT